LSQVRKKLGLCGRAELARALARASRRAAEAGDCDTARTLLWGAAIGVNHLTATASVRIRAGQSACSSRLLPAAGEALKAAQRVLDRCERGGASDPGSAAEITRGPR
jgi:hypothetical protein